MFGGVFLGVATWESLRPRRALGRSVALRWTGSFSLAILGSLVQLALPAALVAPEVEAGSGLLGIAALPAAAELVAGFLLLDLFGYLLHVLMHVAPPLWRLHRLHHADPELDVATALRHHPGEVLVSIVLWTAAIDLLGIPAPAAFAYSALVPLLQLVDHGNVALPRKWDRALAWIIVTPDIHRLHHSADYGESNSNFFDGLTLWDRLFGTFRGAPGRGEAGLEFGLDEFRDGKFLAMHWLLALPALATPPQRLR